MSNAQHDHGRRIKTTWWAATTACALLTASALGTGVAQALVKSLLPTGSQTVVLKVQFRSGGKSSFSGSFAGKPLQGRFERTDLSITEKLCPASKSANVGAGTTFTYGGKYNSSTYSFSGCINSSLVGAKLNISYRMVGKIGSLAMNGRTVGYTQKLTPIAATVTLPFTGKVGNQIVNGTATLKETANGPNTTASLVARMKIGT